MSEEVSSAPTDEPTSLVKVHLDGKVIEIEVGRNESILNALQNAGHHPPFKCTVGVCGACRALCESGTVALNFNRALEAEDLAEGQILTCQARPTSPEVEVRYHFF